MKFIKVKIGMKEYQIAASDLSRIHIHKIKKTKSLPPYNSYQHTNSEPFFSIPQELGI